MCVYVCACVCVSVCVGACVRACECVWLASYIAITCSCNLHHQLASYI